MKIVFLIAPLILFFMPIQSQAHELGECKGWACQTLERFYTLPPEEQEKRKRTVLDGRDCLSYLQDAVVLEMEMLELHPHHHLDVSRDARLAMVKKMNAKSAERIVAMNNYQECVNSTVGFDRVITPDDYTNQGDPIEHAVKAELLGSDKGLKRRVRDWAESLDRALDKIPGLLAIDSFLEESSDFDMTKKGTGHKVAFEMVAATLGEAGLSYLVKGLPWVKAAKAAGAVDEIAEGAGGASVKGTGAVDEIGGGAGNIGSRSGSLLEEVGSPPKLIDDLKTPQLTKEPPIDHPPPPRFRPDESEFAPPPPLETAPPIPRRPIVDAPPPPTGIGEGIITDQVWKVQLPPGVELPPAIGSRPRPTLLQQQNESCAQACVKMVSETQLGVSYPESWYQGFTKGIAPADYSGGRTLPKIIPELLSEMQIPNKGLRKVTFDELVAATSKGDPAIVGLNGQHAVVVDGIIPTPTGELVVVRDPANLNLLKSDEARQAAVRAGFKNAPVMTRAEFERDFLNPFTGFGEAVITGSN